MKTQSLKECVDNISLKDIQNLRVCKTDKTVNMHLERIKLGRFEKNEISALTKLISSTQYTNTERKLSVKALTELSMDCVDDGVHVFSNIYGEVMHFKKSMKISKDQSDLGKAWLKNYFFKLDGKPRNGKNTEGISDRVLAISKSVSRFEFIGVLICKNPYNDINDVLPIYRTYNRKGEYFDYAPIHWGMPVIMEGY